MLQKIGAEYLKRMLFNWMSGQARVNDAPVLIPFVRVGLLGIAASIAGGVLFMLACMGLLAALYLYVSSEGLSPALSLVVVSGVTFAFVLGIFFGIQAIFKSRVNAVNEALKATPPVQIDDAVIEVPRAILAGFLQGILGDDDRNHTHKHTPRN
jgi:hypothetical protein